MNSTIYKVKGAEVYRIGQEYDARGLLAKRSVTSGVTQAVYDYAYDSKGQLTEMKIDGVMQEQYSYDVNGNRLTRTIGGSAPEVSGYGPNDQLQNVNNVSYTFNADGQLTQRGSDVFHYGPNGELLFAEANGKTIDYTYDALGRRTARSAGTNTTQYLYGNPLDVQQVTASVYKGTVTAYYYNESGLLFSFDRGGARYYVTTDGVGTPQSIFDSSGKAVKSYQFDSFGVLLGDSNPDFELSLGYAGGIADSDTKLVRFGYRDYDPASGRWTVRDPIIYDSMQANLYGYVNNNPVMFRDPCGLFCIGVSGYAGLGGGASVCFTDEGIGGCAEVGFGAGGGVDLNLQGLPEDGISVEAGAKLKSPAGGIGGGVKYSQHFDGNCPEWKPYLKGDIGPFSIDLLNVGKSGAKAKKFDIKGPSSEDFLKLKVNGASIKAEAAIKGKVCGSIRHP